MLNPLIAIAMRSRALRVVLDAVHAREAAGALLRRRPLRRRVPGSDLTYRVTTLDNLLVAREIFDQGEYGALAEFRDARTFADLGCNCGYFTLALAAAMAPAALSGLAVDAHPDMVEATRWHLEHNGLAGVHALWGLLGEPEGGSGRFFVNVDAAGSSRFDRVADGKITANPWREIVAPTVSLGAEWARRFGDAPCDILKVDIEGSEDALLRRESAFLARVGVLAIEVHRWIVDADTLAAFLDAQGFSLHRVLRSDETIQVALFVNRRGRFRSALATADGHRPEAPGRAER